MQWNELFNSENEPSMKQVKDFVDNPLWNDLDDYLRKTYNVKPKLSHSNCAMDKGMWKGWNIKYKKSGKALCTLYPKKDYILSLVPVGKHEMTEAELLAPLCTEYTQDLFKRSAAGRDMTSLAFEVKDKNVLHDMKRFIALRVR